MGNILDELHVCDLVEVELSECDLVEVYTAGKLEPFREDPDNAKPQEKVATLRKSREIQPSRFSGRPSTEDLPLAILFVDDLADLVHAPCVRQPASQRPRCRGSRRGLPRISSGRRPSSPRQPGRTWKTNPQLALKDKTYES